MRWTAVREALRRGLDGAVVFDARPSGAVYLLDGLVAHAETPGVAGLGERLVAAGRLTSAQWSAVRADLAVGVRPEEALVGHGVGRHETAASTEAVLVDSILALLADPAGGDLPARFLPGARPGVATGVRLDEATVEDVLAQRPADAPRADLGSASVVEPAAPAWRWRVVTAEDWRVLCRVGESARIRDLARTTELGVGEVVDRVAGLVRAGLCVVRPDPLPVGARAAGAAVGSAPVGGSVRAAVAVADRVDDGVDDGVDGGVGGAVEAAALPRRVPGGSLAPVAAAPEGALAVRPPGLDVPAPDTETLRRLLGSLRRLDE